MGNPATGPITVIGAGVVDGLRWRYSVYQSADGWCTQLELGDGSGGAGCGVVLELPDGMLVELTGQGSGTGQPDQFEGLAAAEVDEIWLVGGDGTRYPATLMDLGPAAPDLQAFLAFVPAGTNPVSLTALDSNGDVVETIDLAGFGR